MLLCAVSMSACLGSHYFEPEVLGTSDQEERISYLGDTCWFEVEYQQVMTKFQPGMAFKSFKYVVDIEGVESEEPTVVTNDSELAALTGELKEKFPEFYKEWYKENDDYPKYSRAIIAFAIPANLTQAERKVEVKVCIADDYRTDTENWGEWETVLFIDDTWYDTHDDEPEYWKDEYTYVIRVGKDLESGKKYGVVIPSALYNKNGINTADDYVYEFYVK